MAEEKKEKSPFDALTWDDLDNWAGGRVVERGRSYQRRRAVSDLATTPDGGLVAWVLGTERYATKVAMREGRLSSACTCPYGYACKHAVAVVLDYLEKTKKQAAIPVVKVDDPRLRKLAEEIEEDEEDEENDEIDEYDANDANDASDENDANDANDAIRNEDEPEPSEASDRSEMSEMSDEKPPEPQIPSPKAPHKPGPDALTAFLNQKTKEQLVDTIRSLAASSPGVKSLLDKELRLATGKVDKVVQSIQDEIAATTAEPAWVDSWRGGGSIPDYSPIREGLTKLLETGHPDEVVRLGEELFRSGIDQVEQSNDEGETATELAQAMEPVWQALPQSSLSPRDKILWAIDALLLDEYDVLQDTGGFWESGFTPENWNEVADALAQRLQKLPVPDKDHPHAGRYRRDQLSNWLIRALESAGRPEDALDLRRKEAEKTASYERLVRSLIAAGLTKEAEEWIRKGIADSEARGLPGIATSLLADFRKIRESEGNWAAVAAMDAEDFFLQPSLRGLLQLEKSAQKAGVWPDVRANAMNYLETGKRPQHRKTKPKDDALPDWPLPDCPLKLAEPRQEEDFPAFSVLIQIAIHEQKPEEVLRWYDLREEKDSGQRRSFYGDDEDSVATAAMDRFPGRAMAIWRKLAEAQMARTGASAYETAAGYLRKMRAVMLKNGKNKEWESYLATLRRDHKRKPRLIETLDRLEQRPILDR